MASKQAKRHFIFNIVIIVVPWLSLILMGKRNFKRYWIAGVFIIVIEIINHLYGKKRKWWYFYSKKKSFLTNELPFSIGPYMPLSMWILKYTYGDLKKFMLTNGVSDGLFAFVGMKLLEKIKIIRLNRLNTVQFFFYLYYKAIFLYGVQYLVENKDSIMKYLTKHKDSALVKK